MRKFSRPRSFAYSHAILTPKLAPLNDWLHSFRDLIMRELDEGASSVETAQEIMQQHFQPQGRGSNRSGASDALKLAVLVDWAREAGIETGPTSSLTMGGAELAQVLHNMAQWLFNT